MSRSHVLAALAAAALFVCPARADESAVRDFVAARDAALVRLSAATSEVERDDALATLDAAARALEAAPDESGADEDAAALARERARLVIADADLAAARLVPETPRRAARVERALAAYQAQVDEGFAGPGLLFHAYVQRVEALLELGRDADAGRAAEELTFVVRPYDPVDPTELAALDALVLETCVRAHVLWARALLRLERPGDALVAAEAVAARAAGHALAPLLALERARALCALGRGVEAGAALEALVVAARATPEAERLEGLGMSRTGALACRALADLDLTGALPLDDPAVAFDAGLGHLLAARRDHALAAWKRVLVVARTPEERARWLPEAVDRVGKLLYAQERWLEAALAFETLLVLAPDAGTDEGARLAMSAATRAARQLGEELSDAGPAGDLYRRIEASAARSESPALHAAGALRRGDEAARAGRWLEAVASYLRVPAERPERAGALVRAGECLLRLFRAAGDAAALDEARALLGPVDDPAAATVLAEVELEAGRPAAALEALARVTTPSVRAARARARALLATDAVEQALAAWRTVAAEADDPHHAPFAVELAAALRARAGAILERPALDAVGAADARALLVHAAEVVAAWAARPGLDPAALTPERALWAARALFEGQRAGASVPLYASALARTPLALDEPALRARGRAEAALAHATALGGDDLLAGWEALVRARDATLVRERSGRALSRGVLVERTLTGPWRVVREGRQVAERVHVTVVRDDAGVERRFVDVSAAESETRFQVVEGDRPPAGRVPGDERTLTLDGRSDPVVLLGLERAAWARWTRERDQRFLLVEALPATNAVRALLRVVDEGAWARLAACVPGEPVDLALRRWDADLRLLEVKLALERWAEVTSDLRMLELLQGRPAEALVPAPFLPRLEALRRALAAKR